MESKIQDLSGERRNDVLELLSKLRRLCEVGWKRGCLGVRGIQVGGVDRCR